MQSAKHLLNFSLENLAEFLRSQQVETYRARQIKEWIHHKMCRDFTQMSNLPKNLRQKLDEWFTIETTQQIGAFASEDGTTKLAIRLHDRSIIEAVYIPEGKRHTGCLSTQAGCPLDCQFCASAYAPYKRNLEVGEILEQVWHISSLAPQQKLTNLVLMGIGEPLLNPNTCGFLVALTADWGGGFSPRRITLSTAGMVPKIYQLAEGPVPVNLAISLHASTDELRRKIMPKVKYSIEETIAAAKHYFHKTRRAVTFEYVLLQDINDSPRDAYRLATLLQGFPRKVNLIPYNPIAGLPFRTPGEDRVKRFISCLREKNIPATTRKKKGRKVKGACGQLRLSMESNQGATTTEKI